MTSRRAQILPVSTTIHVQQSTPPTGSTGVTSSTSPSPSTSTSSSTKPNSSSTSHAPTAAAPTAAYWQQQQQQQQQRGQRRYGMDENPYYENSNSKRNSNDGGSNSGGGGGNWWRLLSPVRFSAREKRNVALAALVALTTMAVLLIWLTRPTSTLSWNVSPSEVSFPVVASRFGESCFDACKRVDMMCQASYFPYLNDCKRLRQQLGYGDDVECGVVEGYDLPAYDRHFKRLHTLMRGSSYSMTCGGAHANTKRACPCVARKPARIRPSVHVVYSVEAGHYMHWQAMYMHHWFKQLDWPNARLTRLLSASECDDLCAAPHNIPTHVVPPYNYSRDSYRPYNKPFGVMHWMAHAKPTADIIVVIDPDCMFVRPFDFVELVETNRPIAQKAFFTFNKGSVDKHVIDRYSKLTGKFCDRPEPSAVPYILTREDMRRVVPLWLKYTEVVRSDSEGWLPEWSDMPGVPWVAEMLGYVLATCELGMKHQIWPELQLVPGVNATSMGEPLVPLLHYHTPVWVNGHKWVKYPEDAATNFPWPLHDSMGPIEKYFFRRFHNASKTFFDLPTDNFVWKGTDKQFRQ